MIANNRCRDEETVQLSQIELSKEVTDEILRDDFIALIAIGKNGQAVRFLPYGSSSDITCCNSVKTELLKVSIAKPKRLKSLKNNLRLVTDYPKQSIIHAGRCLCKFMGKTWFC
jgi:hypothetical protein